MSQLRVLYESLGHERTRSFIQSGNVVFSVAGKKSISSVREQLEEAIEKKFGFRVDVVIRTLPDWDKVIAGNPLAEGSYDPAKLLVVFYEHELGEAARKTAEAMAVAPETLKASSRELYVYFPDGMARPKTSLPRIEKTIAQSGTGRNWNTVLKLRDLALEVEAG
jgi:uncharacterized protein (DUF1697 family)